MTNREKAKEIAESTLTNAATSFLGWINEMSADFCRWSAEEMANWKDNQFKSLIDAEITRIKDNMTKCNIGEIYGSTIDTGYRMAVEHMLQIMENLKSKI